MHNEVDVQSQEDCLKLCQNFEECNWFTFLKGSSSCFLMAACQSIDESCQDCTSGESRCQEPEEGKLFYSSGIFYVTIFHNIEMNHEKLIHWNLIILFVCQIQLKNSYNSILRKKFISAILLNFKKQCFLTKATVFWCNENIFRTCLALNCGRSRNKRLCFFCSFSVSKLNFYIFVCQESCLYKRDLKENYYYVDLYSQLYI